MSKHLLLLNDVARSIGEAKTLQEALQGVVKLVAQEMEVDVCSIWLLDAAGAELTLSATEGLSPEAVGEAKLEQGAGLAWQVLIQSRPVSRDDASADPHYLYIPVTQEQEFSSYLGLRLVVRGDPIGVLTIQTRDKRSYRPEEVQALSAIASQIAPVVDNARLLALIGLEARDETEPARAPGPRRVLGTPCSTGVVAGELLRLDAKPPPAPPQASGFRDELVRLERACAQTRRELLRMQDWLREHNAEEAALVFTVQLMLLDDPSYLGRMRAAVEAGVSAHSAIEKVSQHALRRFSGLQEVYFRERAQDVHDLTARILRHAGGKRAHADLSLKGKIAVLPRLTPSRMVSLCAEGVKAVLTGGGGATSHAAMLARSLDLPLVVGLRDFVNEVRDGQRALVDAASGEVVLDPPEPMVEEARRVASASVEALRKLVTHGAKASGRILFEANVSLWGDTVRAKKNGADGVGLYRTEFAFLMRPDLPGEEEQKVLYRRIVDAVAPKPVTFRLLDAGGDKLVPALAQAPEPNPFLGYRSLRILLDHPAILEAQARAILHALKGTRGRLLVPMVGSIEEFRAVREVLERVSDRLPPVGAMIEVPSALLELDEFCSEADFISVGTNDLTQHLLGVDRTNARVTRFFEPCHPALIRALHCISEAARAGNKPLGICGEMASNPLFLPLWLGLGVQRLSVHTSRIRILRTLEAGLDADLARAAVREMLDFSQVSDIRGRLESLAAPEVLHFVKDRGGR